MTLPLRPGYGNVTCFYFIFPVLDLAILNVIVSKSNLKWSHLLACSNPSIQII